MPSLDVLFTCAWPRLSLWRLSTPQPAICVRRSPAKEEQQEEEQHTQYKGAIYSHSGGLTGQVYEQGGGGGGEVGKPIVHTAGKSKLRAQSRPLTAIVFYWRAESAKSITPAYRTPYVALPLCSGCAAVRAMGRRRARAPPTWENMTKAAHKVLWVLVTMPAERASRGAARIFRGIFAQIFPSCAPEPRNALQMVPKGPKFSGAMRRETHHQISPRLLNMD